jgi:hypothetical protein
MSEAKTVAVAGDRLVLGDGKDFCSSESEVEHSERRDEIPISEMYTAGMLDEEGNPVLGRARVTEEQAGRLRNRRRAGGSAIVSGAGGPKV